MAFNGRECDHYNNLELAYANENIQSKLWYKSLKRLLFINNIDIFAVYKTRAGDSSIKSQEEKDISNDKGSAPAAAATLSAPNLVNKRNTGSMYRRKELSMTGNPVDLRRKRWARPICTFVAYIFIKAWVIAIAQISLLKRRILMPRGYSEPWLSLDAALTIGRYLGNPLRDLRDVSLVAYLAPTSFNVMWLIWFPSYLREHPLDVGPLRFLFKPCHELKRVDLAIKQRVSDVKLSLWMHMNQRIEKLTNEWILRHRGQFGFYKFPRQCWRDELRDSIEREQLYCIELDEFLTKLSVRHLKTLRPATFSIEHYLKTTAKIGAIVIGAQVQYFGVWIVTAVVTEAFVYKLNCGEFLQNARFKSKDNSSTSSSSSLPSSNFCNPLQIFSLPDLIGLIELPANNFLVAFIVSLNIILVAIVNGNQAELIESLKHLMHSCANNILRYSHRLSDSFNATRANNIVKGHQACPIGSTSSLNSLSWQLEQASSLDSLAKLQPQMVSIERHRRGTISQASGSSGTRLERLSSLSDQLEFDKYLLQSLIRVFVCEQELADNAKCLSVLTRMTFDHLLVATLFAAAGAILGVSDPYYIRAYFLFVGCMSFNFMAAHCARLYSRITKLQRIVWTILAANAQIIASRSQLCKNDREKEDSSEENDSHHDTQGSFDTFATHSWRKFALATSSGFERFCVRPYGFRFTYGNVIRANFFFISSYALARGPQ